MDRELFIGLMSGTSVDSIDAALIEFTDSGDPAQPNACLISSHNEAISPATRADILQLCEEAPGEIERLGELDRRLGSLFAQACHHVLKGAQITPQQVSAIGSHGQTIRHRPRDAQRGPEAAFSCQIGDPNTIAELTGITTVADFRRRDIAAGGQGAPLVPRFHEAVFGATDRNRAIINIGGMANITLLAGRQLGIGYDTGPGNVLMDAWIAQECGANYDHNGDWASQGEVQAALLQDCLAHPFFQLVPPKSTGRETFNLGWLQQQLKRQRHTAQPKDIQATLLELTAQTISQSVLQATPAAQEVYVCGGGAYNKRLMERLTAQLAPIPVLTTSELGIAPAWVEASAFAWLARQTLNGLTGNAPLATGAREARILGGIFPAA